MLLDEHDDTGASGRRQIMTAIAGSVVNPLVSDLDDGTLRTTLLLLTERVLNLPG